jgi:hypothetical protein
MLRSHPVDVGAAVLKGPPNSALGAEAVHFWLQQRPPPEMMDRANDKTGEVELKLWALAREQTFLGSQADDRRNAKLTHHTFSTDESMSVARPQEWIAGA